MENKMKDQNNISDNDLLEAFNRRLDKSRQTQTEFDKDGTPVIYILNNSGQKIGKLSKEGYKTLPQSGKN